MTTHQTNKKRHLFFVIFCLFRVEWVSEWVSQSVSSCQWKQAIFGVIKSAVVALESCCEKARSNERMPWSDVTLQTYMPIVKHICLLYHKRGDLRHHCVKILLIQYCTVRTRTQAFFIIRDKIVVDIILQLLLYYYRRCTLLLIRLLKYHPIHTVQELPYS